MINWLCIWYSCCILKGYWLLKDLFISMKVWFWLSNVQIFIHSIWIQKRVYRVIIPFSRMILLVKFCTSTMIGSYYWIKKRGYIWVVTRWRAVSKRTLLYYTKLSGNIYSMIPFLLLLRSGRPDYVPAYQVGILTTPLLTKWTSWLRPCLPSGHPDYTAAYQVGILTTPLLTKWASWLRPCLPSGHPDYAPAYQVSILTTPLLTKCASWLHPCLPSGHQQLSTVKGSKYCNYCSYSVKLLHQLIRWIKTKDYKHYCAYKTLIRMVLHYRV